MKMNLDIRYLLLLIATPDSCAKIGNGIVKRSSSEKLFGVKIDSRLNI